MKRRAEEDVELKGVENILKYRMTLRDTNVPVIKKAKFLPTKEPSETDSTKKGISSSSKGISSSKGSSSSSIANNNQKSKPVKRIRIPQQASRLYPLATLGQQYRLKDDRALERQQKERTTMLKNMWLKQGGFTGLSSDDHNIGRCKYCDGECFMDRNESKMFCRRCAASNRFISPLFCRRDYERDDIQNTTNIVLTNSSTTAFLNHMKKFGDQWVAGFNGFTPEVYDFIYNQYNLYNHTSDPHRVQSCRTQKLLEGHKMILSNGKTLRSLASCTERLSKELRGDGIPEFDQKDLNLFYYIRRRIGSIDNDDDQKTKKSLSNNMYFRQLSRIHNLPQGRLFQHVKTKQILLEQTRSLERILLEQEVSETSPTPTMINWQMFPCT
jgi:hypothetical protein